LRPHQKSNKGVTFFVKCTIHGRFELFPFDVCAFASGAFGFSRRHRWEREKNRRDQTPENSDGARDTKTGKCRVARKSE
jgi:hypothetical protein